MTVIAKEKYPVVLVIGNGFDLACGLKSKYDDFFSDRFCADHVFADFFRNQEEVLDEVALYGLGGRLITLWDLIFWNDAKSHEFSNWADVEQHIFDYLKDFVQRTRNLQPPCPVPIFPDASPYLSWLNAVKRRILLTAYSRLDGIRIFQEETLDEYGSPVSSGTWINCTAYLKVLFNELKLFEKEFDNYLSRLAREDRDNSNSDNHNLLHIRTRSCIYCGLVHNGASEKNSLIQPPKRCFSVTHFWDPSIILEASERGTSGSPKRLSV